MLMLSGWESERGCTGVDAMGVFYSRFMWTCRVDDGVMAGNCSRSQEVGEVLLR